MKKRVNIKCIIQEQIRFMLVKILKSINSIYINEMSQRSTLMMIDYLTTINYSENHLI